MAGRASCCRCCSCACICWWRSRRCVWCRRLPARVCGHGGLHATACAGASRAPAAHSAAEHQQAPHALATARNMRQQQPARSVATVLASAASSPPHTDGGFVSNSRSFLRTCSHQPPSASAIISDRQVVSNAALSAAQSTCNGVNWPRTKWLQNTFKCMFMSDLNMDIPQ